jgi:hypothetical protein
LILHGISEIKNRGVFLVGNKKNIRKEALKGKIVLY